MLWVKFESIYTETDRYGNQRRWENRFEAAGSGHEVCMVLENLMAKVQLPGIQPLSVPGAVKRHLLEDLGENDWARKGNWPSIGFK